jgi:hypothetical protein
MGAYIGVFLIEEPIMNLQEHNAFDPDLPTDFSFYRERAQLLRRQELERQASGFLARLAAFLKRRETALPRQG